MDVDYQTNYDVGTHLYTFCPISQGVLFGLHEDSFFPEIALFFSRPAIERMIWLNSWFCLGKKRAQIVLDTSQKAYIDGKIIMEMKEFPIEEYAKAFNEWMIARMGIKKINAAVVSRFICHMIEEEALNRFFGKNCKVTFGCFDQRLFTDKRKLLETDAQVSAPHITYQ